ncbi:hypothetical protein [Thalassococcus lentus]|uniref:Transposase n=1 Tax=Thalassococcus lentus TaxID=1210524 RepID=A0ABT4XTH0_9RHOB|nr:hypothetical protein [Thalassococcus lentus]MDA7425254.1 hypothetical protein [Thalassococcus lentus]
MGKRVFHLSQSEISPATGKKPENKSNFQGWIEVSFYRGISSTYPARFTAWQGSADHVSEMFHLVTIFDLSHFTG